MKSYFQNLLLMASLLWMTACNKNDDKLVSKPVIQIEEKYTQLDGLNAGEKMAIPVTVKAAGGVKRLGYYIITKTANGTSSGTPVYNDQTGFPEELTDTIRFTVTNNFAELVVIAFDQFHNNSEIHITTDNIRTIPQILFKDGVKFRESVFEGKTLQVEGSIASDYELKSLQYHTIVNGVASTPTSITFSNAASVPFGFGLVVQKGLSAIIISTLNQYNALVVDTFKIGRVEEDAVSLTLASGSNKIEKLYNTISNTITGTVFSGSDVTQLQYAIKKNGSYEPSVDLPLGTPADEFSFSFDFLGEASIEAIKISARNGGGKAIDMEYPVGKVYSPLKVFRNVVLTTEIGPGKKNFFSAYQEPHVFEAAEAAPYDEMIDFGLIKYTATSNNIFPPAVYVAGPAYANALAPYMVGFDKAPYTLVTAERPSVNQVSFDTLQWDTQLMDHIANKVVAPVAAGGENYNVHVTNRRTNNVFNVGKGFYIGWGQWDPIYNHSFGIVLVKDYVISGNFATITLDIKVPMENMRVKYNPVSIFNYP